MSFSRAVFRAFARTIAAGEQDHVSYQQQINYVNRVVRQSDNKYATAGHYHDEIAMNHFEFPPIGKMNYKRLEGLGTIYLLICSIVTINSE
jgi:hypothetical protein